MLIEAYRLMHDDGGIGEIEHVSMHMDSVTRELLSETGAYPAADPELIPQAETWSRPETSGGGYGQAQLTHLLGAALWVTDLRGEAAFALMTAPLGAQVELHDAVTLRFTNGAIGTMGGASSHLGGADNRHAVELRAVGARGMFHMELRDNVLWRYRGEGDEVRVALDEDAGLVRLHRPHRRRRRRRARPHHRRTTRPPSWERARSRSCTLPTAPLTAGCWSRSRRWTAAPPSPSRAAGRACPGWSSHRRPPASRR